MNKKSKRRSSKVIINGTTLWTYTSSDTGPTLTNLNSS
jgi:hypothetical protein